MKNKKTKLPRILAVALVLAAIAAASSLAAASGVNVFLSTPKDESIHEKIDISEISGDIADPPMLTSAASSIAAEKAWYEYVYYSSVPVGYYYVGDNTRISFYDPYDYSSALIMEVDDSITDWSSMNSMEVSYTTGESLTNTSGESTNTTTSVLVGYTDTEETTEAQNTVTTTVTNNTNNYNTSKTVTTDHKNTWDLTILEQSETEFSIGVVKEKVIIGATETITLGDDDTHETVVVSTDASGRSGYSESTDTTTVVTGPTKKSVTKTVADRVTKATGYSVNNAIAFATNNSTTITKTYNAGYFNSNGAPLQWKVIKYTVKMPMKYQVEYLIDGEWIFGDFSYCLLNTIQGTTRAYLKNNQAYYEHWGTGEPVTWDEFWGQFFTEESLVSAYKNKLYPNY